ncbi:helix-turn-helix domain-containing protein [Streptomyces sp. NPDC002536]
MHRQTDELQGAPYSPTHIRATWSGTASVEDASKALGFSRAKGYNLVRQGEFPCRVIRIGRKTRVVTASLLRVLDSGEPEYSSAPTERCAPS